MGDGLGQDLPVPDPREAGGRRGTRLEILGILLLVLCASLAGSAQPPVASPSASPGPTASPAPGPEPVVLPVLPLPSPSPYRQPSSGGSYAPAPLELPLPSLPTLPRPSENPPGLPDRPLTADEAALLGLAHQPGVDIAAWQVEAARGRTRQVQAPLNPQVSVATTYGFLDQNLDGAQAARPQQVSANAATSGSTGFTTTLTVSQLLWDFSHTRDLVRQARLQESAAWANLAGARSDLVAQVKSAFYSYVQNLRLVTVARENLESLRAHEALAWSRFRGGVGLPRDVVQAQAALAAGFTSLSQAETVAASSRVALAQLMGIDPRTPLVPAESGEPFGETGEIDALTEQALLRRPELASARAGLQAAELGLEAAYSSNAPSISLQTHYQQIPLTGSVTTNRLLGQVVAQWDVIDGGARAGSVQQARALLATARDQERQARLQVLTDVSQAWLNLHTAAERVQSAEVGVRSAQESLRLAVNRYRAGVGLFLDVLDAQSTLVQALADRVNAQRSVDLARVALARAVAEPLPGPPGAGGIPGG